jgi:putative spermidine/putrescine transport system ATP-binding protein
VTNRVFQGNHWLYQLATPLGDALVIRQNDGGACPVEGDEVHLVWRADAMRAVAAGNRAG